MKVYCVFIPAVPITEEATLDSIHITSELADERCEYLDNEYEKHFGAPPYHNHYYEEWEVEGAEALYTQEELDEIVEDAIVDSAEQGELEKE
jgi:hypothetical protein